MASVSPFILNENSIAFQWVIHSILCIISSIEDLTAEVLSCNLSLSACQAKPISLPPFPRRAKLENGWDLVNVCVCACKKMIPCALHNYPHSRQKGALLSGDHQEEGDCIWKDGVLSALDDCPLTTLRKSLNQARGAVIVGSLDRIRERGVGVGLCLWMIVDLTWGLRDESRAHLLSWIIFIKGERCIGDRIDGSQYLCFYSDFCYIIIGLTC